jgi:hypothetical protein
MFLYSSPHRHNFIFLFEKLNLNNKEPYIISNKASSWIPVPLNSKRAKKSVYKFDETLQKIVKKSVYKFDETFFSYIVIVRKSTK